MELSLRGYVWARCLLQSLVARDEAGEGVISTAIAVLIMAALGALMWVGFRTFWSTASTKTTTQLNSIGS